MTNKDMAEQFLNMIVSGQIEEAYAQYTSADFLHHNQYFAGDAAALKKGMIDNHETFPDKQYTMHQVIADGDRVAIHGLMKLNDQIQVAVVHIVRFEGGKIAEMRDVGQVLEADSPNSYGPL